MFAAGWRKGMQLLHGTYSPSIKSQRLYNSYLNYLLEMEEFDKIFSKRFKAIAPIPHQMSHDQLVQLQGSSMSHQDYHQPIQQYEFASNVVFTMNNF